MPDMKKHDVDNDCKDDEDIWHYNDEYKYDTSNNCEKEKNVEEYHHGNKGSGSVPNHNDKKNNNPKYSSTHEDKDALQVFIIQCDHESLLKYSKK